MKLFILITQNLIEMAKPILVVDVSFEQLERQAKIEEYIKTITGNEYHVLLRGMPSPANEIRCFNDCNGLADIEIEKLINELKEIQCNPTGTP